MNYQAGQIYEFEVVKEFGDEEDFFRFRVPGVGEGRLPKLKFQRKEALPDKMRCRVKYVNNGVPVISHYMPQYVSRFYGQGAQHGREFDFEVLSLPARPGDPYILEDVHGMRFNLRSDAGMPLSPGQTVQCHFTKLTDSFFNLERCRADMRLPFVSPGQVLDKIGVGGALRSAVLGAIGGTAAFAESSEELSHNNPRWILTALQAAVDTLAQWFIGTDIRRHHRYLRAVLDVIRRSALYVIEDSRFLRNQPSGQRRELQGRVTRMVEALEPYGHTLKLFRDGGEVEFVEEIMNRLRESGYLYHPARQFSVLMLILRTDPSLVKEYLGRIFDTIMEWELETWTTEPFRSAFVGQFEIYIRHASAQLEKLPQAESQADKDLLEKIVTAVALQTLIGGDDDPARSRRNRSLLYRCIALLRPASADTLLDKAFLTINGTRMPVEYKYDHIRQPLMLMTRASVAPGSSDTLGTTSYTSGNVTLTVGPDGVSLRRTDELTDTRAVPTGIFPWTLGAPQVYLDNIPALAGNKFSNLEAHRRLWGDIETALFEQRTAAVIEKSEQRKADIGDEVLIVINPDELSGGDNPCWQARIDDEGFIAATGTISRSDIVDFLLRGIDLDFNRRMAREAFVDQDGSPRHFVAKVTGIATDGLYRFSMSEDIDNQRGELLDFNSTYLAVITQKLGYEYRTISETGYGFYLQRDPGEQAYPPGTVVEFRLLDISNPSHLSGTIVGLADRGSKVEKMSAYCALMAGICVAPAAGTKPVVTDEMSDAADQTIDRDDIRELIEIFRFKALSSPNILTAYDYLLFARLMALAAGMTSVADNLRLHASLLRLHQFYAANSRIDADELETYRPQVKGKPLLEIMFHRLEIVSWLGKPEYSSELWETVNVSRNNLENTLARMVLSYNMLSNDDGGDSDASVGRALKNKIAGLLGVNFELTNLKSYGRENQFVEFKSSIVYPARKNKTDKVEADPERQQRVILKIIASFINSSGGTLYIGVNDASRCEAGLFEDLEYYKHRKAKIGNHSFEMKNADNFCVFLENLVRDTWGSLVAGSVQIRIDDDAHRDVIIVEVQPRVSPVKLDDRVYVRRSSSSVALSDEEQAEFEAERGALEQRRREEMHAAGPVAAAPAAVPQSAELVAKAAPETPGLSTSKWRHNVLHSYADNYTSPAGYVYLRNDDTVVYSQEDLYMDAEAECRLALAFASEEAAGYLLMVYEHQRVLKVPLDEIVKKGENRASAMYGDDKLIFATVAGADEALLLILTDTRGNMYRRVVPVSEIESAHLNSTPDRVVDIPGTGDTICCEIVASSAMGYFDGAVKSKLGPRQIGHALKCPVDGPKAARTIDTELEACRPRQ